MKHFLFFIFGLPFLLSACQAPVTSRPGLSSDEISAEEAAQQQMVDDIKAQGGSPKNWHSKPGMRKQFERVGTRIEQAGADVCRELGLPQQGRSCYYHFGIKENDDLNAYADGEKVVLYTGMLHFLQDDEEVAAIMGHELAHNLMAHPEAGKTNTVAGAMVGLLIDGIAATQGVSTQGEFMKTGADVGRLSYSVSFEEEADYVGLYIAARAGYDVSKAPAVWRRMSIENPNAIYNAKTHPSNAARYVALHKTIKEINYKRSNGMPLLPELAKLEE